jgi:hypothetical protein
MRKHSIGQQDSQEQTADGLASEGMRMLNILNCEASAGFRRVAISRATFGRVLPLLLVPARTGLTHNYYATFQEKLDHL